MQRSRPFTLHNTAYGHLKPFVIAEIGVNYEGSLSRAKNMIEQVARAGGHAAKFQTYKADKLAAKDTSPAYWDRSHEPTASQHQLFQRFDQFGAEEYRALSEHCSACGIIFMSTPFDLDAVDMLAPLVPAFKIASADLTNIPLLRKVAKVGKPIILSVGASRMDEIANSLEVLRSAGASDITILHCVLNYPTPPGDAMMCQITELLRLFGDQCSVGYSDHVVPNKDGTMPALDMAAILGAVVLEKHFTDDKRGSGNDHYHSMNESDLSQFMVHLGELYELYGDRRLSLAGQVRAIENARRRIVAARKIAAGALILEDDVIALRSNEGIEISHWDNVVGKHTHVDIEQGMPLHWNHVR